METHRGGGGGDRYTVDPNAFHPYRQPPRGPLLSRFPDDTPIIRHRGDLRPHDSNLSRYSEFEVPIGGQNRQFPVYDQTGVSPPDRFEGGSYPKLFVGSVPQTATENDIRAAFEEHGHVVEVAIIKDKTTGQHQGCCFVKYATSEDADRAMRFLHNQYILPGGVRPIQVRYADRERERLGEAEFKLFVGSLNKQATEKEVEEIFLPYGRVEDVYLMRDEMKQSRGSGFVKFLDGNVAMTAINALNGIYTMKGCEQPLIVRFADSKKPRPEETRLPKLGEPMLAPIPIPATTYHPMSQHGMVPSFDVGMHGFGGQVAPRYNMPSAPIQPLSHARTSIVRPFGQSQPQGPNFAGQTSFSQGFPSQPIRGYGGMLPHQQARSSQQAYPQMQQQVQIMQPLNPSLAPQQHLQSARLQMASDTNTNPNTPTFSLRLILEKDKLTGPNFLDWERNLRIVLKQERKLYVLDAPLGTRPPHNAPQSVKIAYEKHQNDSVDVSCLMLATMIPDLQKNLDNLEAYEMICMLKEMFQKKGIRTERCETIKALHACKMVEGAPVGPHVMKMKGYVDQLERIGYPVAHEFAIDMILNSLTNDYKRFVINYYKNNMDKSISELHEMLKHVEKGIKPKPKKALMVRQGRVDKKPSKDKGKKVGKSNKKPKPVPKPQPQPETKGKSKDAECFHCNGIGHWKRNCPKYLEEVQKKKASVASTSGVQEE